MTLQRHLIFWAALAVFAVAFVAVFKAVLLPFVLGMVIAYFLNPAVEWLGRLGLSRQLAVVLILAGFAAVLGIILAAVIPPAYREILQFTENLPGYIDKAWQYMEPFSRRVEQMLGRGADTKLQDLATQYGSSAAGVIAQLSAGLAAGGKTAIGFISFLVITPVVAYFMMKEWLKITEWVKDLMPRDQKNTIMQLLRDIDKKLAGFVRGQLLVAAILGIVYAVALSLAGLQYGFLIGLGSGLLSVIPMVGSTVGLLVSVIVAWFQAGDWMYVLLIAAIFLTGQFIEGNFLTPRLVGASVGLHPLWIFFALLAGGSLFGIVGVLLAVPVAAVISVLAAFAIRRYKDSAYYQGKTVQKNGKPPKTTSP